MPVPRSIDTSRIASGLVAAAFCAAWPLAAQEPTERAGFVWALENLRTSQCVRFLIEPGAAGKQLRPGIRLVRADQDQTLHPALRSVITGQVEFAAWIPASLCLFYADAVRMGGRRLGSKDPRRVQMMGVWTIAAAEQGGYRRDIAVDLFGTGGEFVRVAEMAKVKASEARSRTAQVPGNESELYDVRIGKTRLVWNGRAVGDSTRVDQPLDRSWLTRGASGTLWRVRATIRPAWTRALVGVLTIEGKDDLAKALKASPTRFVGPRYYGGGGELRFAR